MANPQRLEGKAQKCQVSAETNCVMLRYSGPKGGISFKNPHDINTSQKWLFFVYNQLNTAGSLIPEQLKYQRQSDQ